MSNPIIADFSDLFYSYEQILYNSKVKTIHFQTIFEHVFQGPTRRQQLLKVLESSNGHDDKFTPYVIQFFESLIRDVDIELLLVLLEGHESMEYEIESFVNRQVILLRLRNV